MRYVLLVFVVPFPFLFGISFAIAVMSFRIPTPAGIRAGPVANVASIMVRALTYAGLAFAVGAAVHEAGNESLATAAALSAGPFVAGIVSAPIAIRWTRRRADRARGET
jgi:hypothetical protein